MDALLAFVDERGEYHRVNTGFTAVAPSKLEKDQSLPVRIPIELPPGEYDYTLLIKDAFGPAGGTPSGNYRKDVLTVRELGGSLPVLSDVAVASDSGGSWSPLAPAGPDLGLVPSPAHLTGPESLAWIYFEAYNLTPGGRYETRIRFEPDGNDGEAFDLSFPGDVPVEGAPRTRRVLRLELEDAEPGTYSVSVVVADAESGSETLPHATAITVTK